MRAVSAADGGRANLASDNSVGVFDNLVGGFTPFLAVCRRLWPDKTAIEIAARAGISQRTAERWLAGRHDIPLDAAQALLRSEQGFHFLAALMAGSKALWWQRVELAHENGVTRRQTRELEKRMAALRARRDQLDLDV